MACTVISYSAEKVTEHRDVNIADTVKLKDLVVWIDLKDPSNKELEELERTYGLHHLIIDDFMHEVQRPKIEVYENYFFVVARHITYEKKVGTQQVGIIVGKNYLISVHKDDLGFLEDIREAIAKGGQRINKLGPDYLLYSIIDRMVDNYFIILDDIETEIEAIENDVVKKPTNAILKRVFKAKKDLLFIRKPVWPLREVLHTLQSGSLESVSENSIPYFRDVYDHLINVIDLIETYREIVTASLETYLSSVSNSLNEVVKVLTVVAALFMLPTLIASIYGMNFKAMPEIEWAYGYPFSLFIMLSSMILMYVYFRRKRWV